MRFFRRSRRTSSWWPGCGRRRNFRSCIIGGVVERAALAGNAYRATCRRFACRRQAGWLALQEASSDAGCRMPAAAWLALSVEPRRSAAGRAGGRFWADDGPALPTTREFCQLTAYKAATVRPGRAACKMPHLGRRQNPARPEYRRTEGGRIFAEPLELSGLHSGAPAGELFPQVPARPVKNAVPQPGFAGTRAA